MDSERYIEVVRDNMHRCFTLELNPLEIGVVHGAIRLMILHPEVSKYGVRFHEVAEALREWCLVRYRELGFTEEEIEFLDNAKVEEVRQLTTEVEDKKPEDCKKSGDCQKMVTLLKQDMPPDQRRQSVLEMCAKCDEFDK